MLRPLYLVLAAALAIAPGTEALAFQPPPFPRLGGYDIGGPFNYNDPTYQAALARQSLIILNDYPGLAPGGESMQSVVQAIKAINPNALVFLYVNENELADPTGSGDAWAAFRAQLYSMTWWLYLNGGSGTRVNSAFGSNYYAINNTLFTPKDSSGDIAVDWMTKFFVSQYYGSTPAIDGLYVDNMFWEPRIDGDWNRDGTTDSDTNPTTATWLRQGYQRYVSLARSLMPGKYQLGNVTDWGDPQAVFPEYQGILDGGVLEGMIGASYSPEASGGWQAMMTAYRKIMAALGGSQLAIFVQDGTPTDYQSMRYGLASCLMDNAYYDFTNTAQQYYGVNWFDEFNANLGQAVSNPSTAPWQNGVYRRDFQNGIALVNPKGNGPQTVKLETAYVKIKGTQAPTINDGSTVTSVTLADRDGIILLRQSPVKQPNPPSGVSAQ